MASEHAAIDHDVARNTTSALPDHVAGAGQAFSKVARAPCQDGAVCSQYGPTRQQCVRTPMDLGSRSARGWKERVCDSAGSIQIKARTRFHTERRGLVNHRRTTRQTSDLGLPASRQAGWNDEQHGMAARPTRGGIANGAHSRPAPHLCLPPTRGWCVHGRPRSRCWVKPTTRWPGTRPVPMWADRSRRRT